MIWVWKWGILVYLQDGYLQLFTFFHWIFFWGPFFVSLVGWSWFQCLTPMPSPELLRETETCYPKSEGCFDPFAVTCDMAAVACASLPFWKKWKLSSLYFEYVTTCYCWSIFEHVSYFWVSKNSCYVSSKITSAAR
jgi:hypothetical protein